MYQPGKRLDVYKDDKTHPILAVAGNYSGQNWRLTPCGDGTYKLWNRYSKENLHLYMKEAGSLYLRLASGDSPTKHWLISPVRDITEPDFLT